MNVKAVVEYDGTAYHGFQVQPGRRTIQGELERALASVTQEEIRVVGAGRTDAGVHALGQVISFTTGWDRPLAELQRALNAVLPRDIAVREIAEAPPGFHARYSAVSRQYRYTVLNRPVRSPLAERFAYHFATSLAVEPMAEACSHLVGRHDFASFGRAMREDGSTERTVHRAQCWREDDHVYVDIVADAFLRRMVRRIVGGLLEVGTGRLSSDEFREILLARDPSLIKTTAPPRGLCLIRVNY
ncbi:MAG: tRNA pseudouridine(38-40) synthase TruA [Anaerolineae bacterium]